MGGCFAFNGWVGGDNNFCDVRCFEDCFELVHTNGFGGHAVERGEAAESLQLTRELVKKMPYIHIFYLTQRQPEASLYKDLKHLEKRYLEKLHGLFPSASPDQLLAVFSAFVGLVTIADLPENVLRSSVKNILASLS